MWLEKAQAQEKVILDMTAEVQKKKPDISGLLSALEWKTEKVIASLEETLKMPQLYTSCNEQELHECMQIFDRYTQTA